MVGTGAGFSRAPASFFPGLSPLPFPTVDRDIEQVGQPPPGVRQAFVPSSPSTWSCTWARAVARLPELFSSWRRASVP